MTRAQRLSASKSVSEFCHPQLRLELALFRAQRLSASKSVSATHEETTNEINPVLNAFRHPSQFPLADLFLSPFVVQQCSTPFGIQVSFREGFRFDVGYAGTA